jgi:hypothetical protein
MSPNDAAKMAREYATLLQLKEHHNAQIKCIETALKDLGYTLHNLLLDSETVSMRIKGADFKDKQDRIITPKTDTHANVSKERQPKFFAWLRANKHGSLIKEVVHPATMKSWIKELIDENKPLPPTDLVTIFEEKTVTCRRAPSK